MNYGRSFCQLFAIQTHTEPIEKMSIRYLRLDSFQDGSIKIGFNGVSLLSHTFHCMKTVCIKSLTL